MWKAVDNQRKRMFGSGLSEDIKGTYVVVDKHTNNTGTSIFLDCWPGDDRLVEVTSLPDDQVKEALKIIRAVKGNPK